MMLAVFGPVYGNLNVLESVLDAIEEEGIQTIFCTGDFAVGPDPDAVIETLQRAGVHVVQGESDRQLAQFTRKRKRIERESSAERLAQLERAHRQCRSANIEWLSALPHTRTLSIDGETVVLFNGTISSPSTRLRADDPDELFRRQREVVPSRVFVCGGGDQGFVRVVDGTLFANPGAAVDEKSGDADYSVISTETGEPLAVRRRVRLNSGA